MIDFFIDILLFFLPGGVANATPIIAAQISFLKPFNQAIDNGKTFRGIRIFGANKTWRGLTSGIIAGAASAVLLSGLITNQTDWPITQEAYIENSAFLIGGLLSLGVLLGDIIESFFKRQRKIKPGSAWFPFDQTDYIIGGLLFVAPFVRLEIIEYVVVAGVWFFMHLFFSLAGYLIKWKDAPI